MDVNYGGGGVAIVTVVGSVWRQSTLVSFWWRSIKVAAWATTGKPSCLVTAVYDLGSTAVTVSFSLPLHRQSTFENPTSRLLFSLTPTFNSISHLVWSACAVPMAFRTPQLFAIILLLSSSLSCELTDVLDRGHPVVQLRVLFSQVYWCNQLACCRTLSD